MCVCVCVCTRFIMHYICIKLGVRIEIFFFSLCHRRFLGNRLRVTSKEPSPSRIQNTNVEYTFVLSSHFPEHIFTKARENRKHQTRTRTNIVRFVFVFFFSFWNASTCARVVVGYVMRETHDPKNVLQTTLGVINTVSNAYLNVSYNTRATDAYLPTCHVRFAKLIFRKM